MDANQDIADYNCYDVFEDPAAKIEDFQFKPPSVLNKIDCPRVFISHKQGDEHFAIRTAELAVQEHFFYWLDVLDPFLKLISPGKKGVLINSRWIPLSPLQISLLTAAIVEVALINCTHVIALITEKSRPSRWIPYEYGRAKNSPTIVGDTACWVSPKVSRTDIVEYMLLGTINDTDANVKNWFKYQCYEYMKRKITIPGRICYGGTRQWTAANIKLEDLPDDLP